MEKQLSLLFEAMQAYGVKAAAHTSTKAAPSESSSSIQIHIDGAARGNPGPAGAGIYLVYKHKAVVKKGLYLGEKTNNQAEYFALVFALLFVNELCEKEKITDAPLHIFSDSELLVRQMNGVYKIKNKELARLKHFIDKQLIKYTYQCTHVMREKNKEADKLANDGVDKKTKIPTAFLKVLAHANLSI